MKNFKNPSDAMVREDFPGGCPGDVLNKFERKGRTGLENKAVDYISKLASFRKTSTALGSGKLMQYVPVNGLYVYFRYNEKQNIMCVLNTDSLSRTIDFNDYSERTKGFGTATDVMLNKNQNSRKKMNIPARKIVILELKKTAG